MYITLDELALAATTNTDVAALTASLAENNNFLSLSAYVQEDGYINLSTIAGALMSQSEDNTPEVLFKNHYDRMLEEYLGENYKPLTLADINVPEDFSVVDCNAALTDTRQLLLDRNQQHLDLFTKFPDMPNIGNAFADLKEDGTCIINKAAITKKLEFLEFVKTITPEDIQKNTTSVAMKVLYMFFSSIQPILQEK